MRTGLILAAMAVLAMLSFAWEKLEAAAHRLRPLVRQFSAPRMHHRR